MFSIRKSLILLAATAAIGLGGATAASADTWQQGHPARVEVNHRLAKQDARIHDQRREGEISAAKAHRLHVADRAIHRQEMRMAARDHDRGHLTRHQVKKLNREENRVSRHIPE